MISEIKKAAEAVGITAIITNSDQKLQTQLNRITDLAELPSMLVSWDLTTSLEFDKNGFLKNPSTPIVCLLMSKADSKEKDVMEAKAEEMGQLYIKFIEQLYSDLIATNRDSTTPVISGAQYQLVPKHGLGQHSGIVGRFTMKTGLDNCSK